MRPVLCDILSKFWIVIGKYIHWHLQYEDKGLFFHLFYLIGIQMLKVFIFILRKFF